MFQRGQTVKYFYSPRDIGYTEIVIEDVHDGKAFSTSGSFGDMGPFLMTFDATTGMGIGEYEGTHIEAL